MSDTTNSHGGRVRPPCSAYPGDVAQENAALFTLGALPVEEAAAFARHLAEGCAFCDAEVACNRELTVDLAGITAAATPPPQLKQRLLREVSSNANAATTGNHQNPSIQVWKGWRPNRHATAGLHVLRSTDGVWEETDCPGVRFRQLAVDEERRYVTMLVRMDPGSAYPPHRHAGREECFVLEGDLHVAGEVLRAGDYQCAAANSDHGVQSTEKGCLLLVVSSQTDELI